MTASAPPPPGRGEAPRLCLFGGTFDPVHLGHVSVARAAVEALDLDRVLFLPCRVSPHKQDRRSASADHRLSMLKLAIRRLPWAEIDRFELDQPAPSYSWRTVLAMRERFPDTRLFWLLGGDQWQDLQTWARPEILARELEFIVVARDGGVSRREGWTCHHLPATHPASASAVRASAPGDLLTDWLDPEVATYIHEHRLYDHPG